MSAPKVQFLFDFGSPNAYLAHRVIPAIEARVGARFDYIPVLLGGVFKATGNRSPMEAFAGIPAKLAYEGRERDRFIARHRLTAFALNPHFPVNTLGIMRGAVAAQTLRVFDAYVETMFVAMWEDGRKMDDPAVIGQVLTAAGLPVDRLLALTQDQGVKDRLVANTADAVARGVFGSPSFFVGDELYFGKDRLADVEAAIDVARRDGAEALPHRPSGVPT
jgi:2-hydroxychromene-2-carboxylate isomerase